MVGDVWTASFVRLVELEENMKWTELNTQTKLQIKKKKKSRHSLLIKDGGLSCIVQAYNYHFVFCGNKKKTW